MISSELFYICNLILNCSNFMSYRENFKTFIPSERIIPELTVKAVLVGAFLAIVLGSANAYFGLYAGMTVSSGYTWSCYCICFIKALERNYS